MKDIKAVECDFCPKILRTRSGMRKHEKQCFSNPAVKSCNTCLNLSVYYPSEEDDEDLPDYLWGCAANHLIPFTVEIKDCPKWVFDAEYDNPFGERRRQP